MPKKLLALLLPVLAMPFAIAANLRFLSMISPPPPPQAKSKVRITLPNSTQPHAIQSSVAIADARPLILTNYFKYYDSPLLPLSSYIVKISDQYRFDFRLLPAIAMQESNLCFHIPPGSHNCWGYGIYGDKVTRFESYEEAIDQVARTLSKNYLAQGLKTPEEIMKKYTPPSDGSWADGVNYFLDIMEKGGHPEVVE